MRTRVLVVLFGLYGCTTLDPLNADNGGPPDGDDTTAPSAPGDDTETTAADDETAWPDTDTSGPSGDTSSLGGPTCGNDVAESTEDCDGTDLRDQDCSDFGFALGTLACDACAIDVSGCTNATTCGDGMRSGAEACDGTDLGGLRCQDFGFPGGSIACTNQCTVSTAGCALPPGTCGDDTRNPGEDCDGSDFGGATCADYGFDAGTLACDGSCTVDTSACFVQPTCGDGVRNGSEACDGSDLGGATCATYGYGAGTVGCAGSCTIDSSGCFDPPSCGDGALAATEACDGDRFGGATCRDYGFVGGDLTCTGSCTVDTGSCNNTAVCGDGLRTAPEACDGGDFGGQSCASFGYATGSLACNGCSIDTSACRFGGTWCDTRVHGISSGSPNTIAPSLTVDGTGTIEEVRVIVQGGHDWIGDLDVYLSHGGVTRALGFPQSGSGNCDGFGIIDVAFADAFSGDHEACNSAQDYVGDKRPAEVLSAFAGAEMNGAWTLTVDDTATFDGGEILTWCVVINP